MHGQAPPANPLPPHVRPPHRVQARRLPRDHREAAAAAVSEAVAAVAAEASEVAVAQEEEAVADASLSAPRRWIMQLLFP